MAKLLILGTGNAQKDLFAYCAANGIEVCACSNAAAGLTTSQAYEFECIDISHVDAVLQYARRNAVDLVYSVGSDVAMPTACRVSESLGLPSFVSSRTAGICNNKAALRDFLGPTFPGNIPHQSLRSHDDEVWLSFPLMLKPVDSQGQRGVRKVNNMLEFREHFPSSMQHSKSGVVIAEKYVEGPEVSVNTYSVNGRLIFMLCSDRLVWPQYDGGIIHKHRLPCRALSPDAERRIANLVESTLRKLRISNGPAYFQIKLDEGGPVLMEVTPRLDGCHLWRLIREYCGFDLLHTTITHLLGDAPAEDVQRVRPKAGEFVLEFLCERPGRPFRKSAFRVDRDVYHEWYYEEGDRVRPINGQFEKCGFQIVMTDCL